MKYPNTSKYMSKTFFLYRCFKSFLDGKWLESRCPSTEFVWLDGRLCNRSSGEGLSLVKLTGGSHHQSQVTRASSLYDVYDCG